MMKFFLLAVALCATAGAYAAPLQNIVDDLQQEVKNQQAEIRMHEERLRNQEVIMDSLRDQILKVNIPQKVPVVSTPNVDGTLKGALADIKQLQAHANESSKALAQYKQKISELSQTVESLQAVVITLTEALQAPTKSYKVQSGDTLDKIAKKMKVGIEELKSLNNLKNDKIVIGQTLKLP